MDHGWGCDRVLDGRRVEVLGVFGACTKEGLEGAEQELQHDDDEGNDL